MSKFGDFIDEEIRKKEIQQTGELPQLFDLNKSMGTQTTTPQITETNITPLSIAKTVGQGTAKQYLAAGQFITERLKGTPVKEAMSIPFIPEATSSPFGRFIQALTGTDKPISLKEEDIGMLGEKLGEKLGGKATILLTTLDFTGLGGAKNVYKAFTKTDDILKASKMARTIGVPEDLVLPFAQKAIKITSEKEMKLAVEQLEQTIKMTKVAPKIILELDPLAQEARKYRSAEEFVEAKATFMRGAKTAEIRPGKVGVYLTPDKEMAKVFAGETGVITKAFANIKKTYKIPKASEFEWLDALIENPRDYSKHISELKNKGYDSILSSDKKQLLVFDRNKVFTESQLTDFYNQAVRGQKISAQEFADILQKEKISPTIPELKTEISNTVADEAIKFVKENPESSLVAKEFRNPKTKELIAPPRLFKRIGESIRNGEINIESLPEIVKKYGLNNEETAQLFEDAASFGGRTLQALSRVEKEIRALLPDIIFPKRELTLWEKFKVKYLAVDNFRRSLLVTQLATAARNAISQTGRYSLETLNDGLAGAISKLTGKDESFTPFFEDIAAIFRKTDKKNFQELENLLKKHPLENARLYNTPVGDVALSNKISNTLNVLNRGQEYFFRNLILDAKLHTAAKIKGVEIIKLSTEDIAKAVDEALDWTFAKSPARGSFGAGIMSMYKAMPLLTLINPFPRFMSNAVKFLYDFSPVGIMSLFGKKTRAAIAAGDYNTISKAIIGTSMLGAAVAIRANQNLAGEKWYEIKAGDKRIDTRPFAPFSTYLFFAEIMANGTEKISGSDWAQAAVGINRVAGTGLALIDLIGQKVDTKNAKNVIMPIINQYIGGFTVPFITIKDIIGNFKLEERTVKETKEIPFIGAAMGNIPGLNELLPTKYSMFEDKPLEREKGLLRQITGITIKTKSFIEKELDRMGKDIGDIIPKTGNLEANRIISKQTGVILDKFNDKIKMSEKYQIMGNDEKLKFLTDLISEGKKEAKGEVASDLARVVYNEIKKSKSDKRKETIKNLKNRGLMTENILDYLLPILEAKPLPR